MEVGRRCESADCCALGVTFKNETLKIHRSQKNVIFLCSTRVNNDNDDSDRDIIRRATCFFFNPLSDTNVYLHSYGSSLKVICFRVIFPSARICLKYCIFISTVTIIKYFYLFFLKKLGTHHVIEQKSHHSKS